MNLLLRHGRPRGRGCSKALAFAIAATGLQAARDLTGIKPEPGAVT